jgi:flagellar basal body P-ring formation protein FlgA
VVEHDLAKVGVASSNLVSRSILFLLLFISTLFSQPLYIEKTYCIEEDTLKASFFGYQSNDDPIIVQIPKDRVNYTISTNTLRTAFNDRNVTFIDSSDGVIIFKRNCSLMGKADAITEFFLQKFQEAAPLVMIEEKPRISLKTSLPSDFKRYELIDVRISDAMLKKNSGTFIATFKVGDREKKLYFAYEMNAKMMVFKAKRNLLNGKILTNDDYESVWESLDALPPRVIVNEIPQNGMIKNGVKEGQILTDFHIDIKKSVSKKESVKAVLKEEGLVIEVQATLLEDGNIGDVVKIKTEQGKILNAKILSSHEVIILE